MFPKRFSTFRILCLSLLLVGWFAAPAPGWESTELPHDWPSETPGSETSHSSQSLDDMMPEGIVNVVAGEFGDRIGGGDYGLGNYIPVEDAKTGGKQEIRMFRSPILFLGHLKKASLQVKIGNIKGLYFWIETPPVSSRWIVNLDLQYPDGSRRNIWSKDTKPGVRHWLDVDENTVIYATIVSPESTFKLSKRFNINFCPVQYAVWPDVWNSTPYRTLWE